MNCRSTSKFPPNNSSWRSNGYFKFSTSKTEILIFPQSLLWSFSLPLINVNSTFPITKIKIFGIVLIYVSHSLSPPIPQPHHHHYHHIWSIIKSYHPDFLHLPIPLAQVTISSFLGGLFTGSPAFAPGPYIYSQHRSQRGNVSSPPMASNFVQGKSKVLSVTHRPVMIRPRLPLLISYPSPPHAFHSLRAFVLAVPHYRSSYLNIHMTSFLTFSRSLLRFTFFLM